MMGEEKFNFIFFKKLDFLFYYLFMLLSFAINSLGYEILNLNAFVKDKFYDKKITNFHFCQWQYFNKTIAPDNDILQINYFDIENSKIIKNQFNEIFKQKFTYNLEYDAFCSKIKYCGIYYVTSFFNYYCLNIMIKNYIIIFI